MRSAVRTLCRSVATVGAVAGAVIIAPFAALSFAIVLLLRAMASLLFQWGRPRSLPAPAPVLLHADRRPEDDAQPPLSKVA